DRRLLRPRSGNHHQPRAPYEPVRRGRGHRPVRPGLAQRVAYLAGEHPPPTATVDVRIEGDTVVFDVRGLHKLWAFKSRLAVPRASVLGARHGPEAVRGWKGWRVPGTHVPGLLIAGTFYRDGHRIFWDVRDPANTVVV